LAREVVRRVQTQRKNAGLNIEDRIVTWYSAPGELAAVITAWADYIRAETLTLELVAGTPVPEAWVEEHNVEGATLTLGVRRASEKS
jgi:isoleucyl-tRNA synthetase